MKEWIKDDTITYFFRNKKAGYSMHRVFTPIVHAMWNEYGCSNVCKLEAPSHRASIASILRNVLWAYRHRNKYGINHVTGDVHYLVLGLIGCRTVLTIHDMVTLRIPGNKIKRWILRKLWFEMPLKKADVVTCISDKTRQELLKEFDISSEKIIVVHNPVDSTYRFHTKKFNTSNPRILHIGTGWNKNLERVIQALHGIPCVLVIIGKLTADNLNLLDKHQINYENKVGISDEQMLQEYIDCDIVSFPSIFEGFGMPIIEGQAIGRPVVTSRLEPMMEIAGDGAAFVDPYDVGSIRQGFLEIIYNKFYREDIVDKGLKNVEQYGVKKITEQYCEVYSTLF